MEASVGVGAGEELGEGVSLNNISMTDATNVSKTTDGLRVEEQNTRPRVGVGEEGEGGGVGPYSRPVPETERVRKESVMSSGSDENYSSKQNTDETRKGCGEHHHTANTMKIVYHYHHHHNYNCNHGDGTHHYHHSDDHSDRANRNATLGQ